MELHAKIPLLIFFFFFMTHDFMMLNKHVKHLSFSLYQGTEVKVLELEKKMEELIAEDKPISAVLKQLIQALCAEEVGFV